jgi:hypothetical protein
MTRPDLPAVMEAKSPPRSSLFVRTLTDKELRRQAMRLAADAIVLARTAEHVYARAERKGKGKRKAIVVVAAGAGAVALALGLKSVLGRD